MMQFLHHLPIKRKLMVITMLVSSSALLAAFVAFIVFEEATARKQMAQALDTTAAMTAANCTAGLSFDEAGSVEQALASLSAQPDIVQACVYNKNGRLFAHYRRAGAEGSFPVRSEGASHRFEGQRLELFQPVKLVGETIGTIYLEEDLSELTARLWRCVLIGTAVLVACAGMALFLTTRLQKAISGPLSALAGTVAEVRTNKDYSVRAAKYGDDELGGLIDGFNEMLAQIQERDANLERRVAERTQKLAESEANYYSLVDQMPAGIFRKDKEGRFVFVNSWFCRFKGVAPEDFLGKTPQEVTVNGADSDANFASLAAAGTRHHAEIMQAGQRIEYDEKRIGKDGHVSYFHAIKTPVYGPDGAVVGSQGILLDVTQRKHAEDELEHERDLLRTLLENSTDHIYFKDAQSRFAKVSDSQARQFGVASADDLVGKSDFDFFSEEHARHAYEDEQEIIRTGEPVIGKIERETWMDSRTDSWALTTKMPLRNKAGEIIGTFGISKNITAIKQAEAALAYERDLLKTLLDHSPDSIYFKDRESRYVRLSQSELKNLFHLAVARHKASANGNGHGTLPAHLASLEQFQEYVIGRCDADIYGPEDSAAFYRDEQEVVRTGKSLLGKIEKVPGPNGEVRWYMTTKTPWHNKDGEIIGLFGTGRNITDLKAAETKVEQAHQKLLETSRLAGMAEVATSVLHNVGNVLNSVNVSSTLVLDLVRKSRINNVGRLATLIQEQRDSLPAFFTTDERGQRLPGYLSKLAEHLAAEQAQMITEIELTRKNIEHIKDIVTMQQAYAKVSGVVEKVKVTDLVEDALRINAGALTRHQVEVVRDYPGETIECHAERQKVLQILVNVIRNAKYACDESDRPDKRLVVQVRAGNDRIQITATDNGVGIPAENLTRIFNHGFTTRENGHGFGLHSGALAAREMGGSLTAHSDGPGAGARFVLDLPLQPPQRL